MCNYCSICSIKGDHNKFYSKFIGSIDEDASYYCDICYDKEKEKEELLIKFAIQNGKNIASIVKQDKIIDFINPASTIALIKPMNIHKIVSEIIDGVKKEFVMIDIEEYNNYMFYVACSNKKLINDEKINKKKKQQERQEAVERKKIETIKEKERKGIDKENKEKEKIEMEIKINKYNNEKIKKEKEELKETYKDVFDANPQSTIKNCSFCKAFRIFPYHFKDENNKSFLRTYTKDKKQEKAMCCVDCFEDVQIKKEDKKINHTHNCSICNKSFIAYTNELYAKHLQSIQHKRNEAKLKGKTDLSLLNIKELQNICSKTIDDNGFYRISNYTRLKKAELLEKMNSIYDLLII